MTGEKERFVLTTLRERSIKTGATVVRHSKHVSFQMAEVVVPCELFAAILERIQRFGVPLPLLQRKSLWRQDENMKIPTRRWLALRRSADNHPRGALKSGKWAD